MATIKKYQHVDGYLQYVGSYRIELPASEYEDIISRIKSNEKINPEAMGLILGKAEEVYVKVECDICKKHIKAGEEYRPEIMAVYMAMPAHASCVEKEKAKEKSVVHN